MGRRQAVSVSRLTVSICLDKSLTGPRLVLGACFPSPRRLKQVEDLLAQGSPGPELWTRAGKEASAPVHQRLRYPVFGRLQASGH